MRTFNQISTLRAYIQAAREDRKTIGFVPTMGALHEGHLTLMRKARSECDAVVVSVFVNPTQFGPGEDFERYPRDLARDSGLSQSAQVDALFIPTVEEIYPAGSETVIDLPKIAPKLDGQFRPGHFRGVATVCTKLFNIVSPHRAYFGRKDYQQLKLVERLVSDLFLPITIVPIPTVREPDGLAMSSRNAYLDADSRKAAAVLYRSICAVERAYDSGGRDCAELQDQLNQILSAEPLAQTEYTAIVDAETLDPIETITGTAAVLLAVKIGKTRLIDSCLLGSSVSKIASRG